MLLHISYGHGRGTPRPYNAASSNVQHGFVLHIFLYKEDTLCLLPPAY